MANLSRTQNESITPSPSQYSNADALLEPTTTYHSLPTELRHMILTDALEACKQDIGIFGQTAVKLAAVSQQMRDDVRYICRSEMRRLHRLIPKLATEFIALRYAFGGEEHIATTLLPRAHPLDETEQAYTRLAIEALKVIEAKHKVLKELLVVAFPLHYLCQKMGGEVSQVGDLVPHNMKCRNAGESLAGNFRKWSIHMFNVYTQPDGYYFLLIEMLEGRLDDVEPQ